jgi:hypothetical protein
MGLYVYHEQPGRDKVIQKLCFLQKVAAHEAGVKKYGENRVQ